LHIMGLQFSDSGAVAEVEIQQKCVNP
jgi:hypothetical protein